MFGPVVVRKEAMGVVGAIIPWNVPLFEAVMKVAPAVVAGCTVVLKPAPETPLDAYVFAEIMEEAGLPKGVLSILPAGREVGEYLVTHPLVDKVTFTGSTAAGKKIGAVCGALLRPSPSSWAASRPPSSSTTPTWLPWCPSSSTPGS
jgi:aldehyde dehydrogenase (NAD+)